ncbi:MAG: lytic transglycosylase domain-containing protein [Deltaproteobacteria bacterium]|nr:lytic transglycosylase domain-containing protein [Deltaproteobacteria bacterium]
MCIRWTSLFGWAWLMFMLAGALGCGGAPGRTGRSSGSSQSRGGSVSQRGTVAERTRAVTKKRRGSWGLTSEKVRDVKPLVAKAARENDIAEDLIFGIIWVESRFNPRAVSPVGARGLMQLMPRTADYLADCIKWRGRNNSFSPKFNVAAGSYYIARLIKQFKGDEDMALAAYNAGPTKVRRWMKGSGLPKVSIEYATMVQTARSFFQGKGTRNKQRRKPSGPRSVEPVPVITDDELDRLGLTILIAGLSDKQFGLEREDDANPFD